MDYLLQRGFSPLHLAAKFRRLKVAKLLLDRGVSPDIEGKYNLTPLHVATHYGSTEVALHLLEREAKPQCAAKVSAQLKLLHVQRIKAGLLCCIVKFKSV